ncbi:MAG: hypothetical protein ABJN35_04155, partial [Erythrobacter sp.]
GTAYLRALMHEDGNIRYANYQSEQEVIDYLTANGYDESTFGDWFGDSANAATADKESGAEVSIQLVTKNDGGQGEPEAIGGDIEAMFAQRPGEFASQQFEQVPIEFFG